MPRSSTTGNTSPDLKHGVGYDVGNLPDDIKQEYTSTSSSITALCTVDYEDSDLFLADMLGWSKKVGTQLQRVLPERAGWDDMDDTDIAHYAMDARLVKACTWTENDPETGWPIYGNGLVYAVTFAAPLYAVLEDDEIDAEHERFVVFSDSGTAQNEKIPGGSYWLPATPAIVSPAFPAQTARPLSEVGVRTGRVVALKAKWLDVPFVNYAMLSTLSNKVNSADLEWNGIRYKIGTVLFETWSRIPRVNAFGERTQDLEFVFSVRVDGRTWNSFWTRYPSPYNYLEATQNNDGVTTTFQTADLNLCFSFAPPPP